MLGNSTRKKKQQKRLNPNKSDLSQFNKLSSKFDKLKLTLKGYLYLCFKRKVYIYLNKKIDVKMIEINNAYILAHYSSTSSHRLHKHLHKLQQASTDHTWRKESVHESTSHQKKTTSIFQRNCMHAPKTYCSQFFKKITFACFLFRKNGDFLVLVV